MRKTRNALVATLVLGTVLGTSSLAWADGASENISSVQGGISPNSQRADVAGVASLTAQVQTFDADEGPLTIAAQAAEQVFLDFDDDITILPGASATEFADRQCSEDEDFTGIGETFDLASTSQVIDACGDAVVGSGQAEAVVPTPPGAPVPTAKLELTVTAVNGPETVLGGACQPLTEPGAGGPDGCEFQGGNPQLILHAIQPATNTIVTVEGEIQDSPINDAGTDYGSRLAVTNAPDTAGDAGSLILFNATVGRNIIERVNRPNGTQITKQFPYVRATCGDDGANTVGPGSEEYDFRGEWVYDDDTTDTDTNTQKCGTP